MNRAGIISREAVYERKVVQAEQGSSPEKPFMIQAEQGFISRKAISGGKWIIKQSRIISREAVYKKKVVQVEQGSFPEKPFMENCIEQKQGITP